MSRRVKNRIGRVMICNLLITGSLFAWAVRPIPLKVEIYSENGKLIRVERERHFIILPFKDWTVRPSGIIGCGRNHTTCETTYPLIFIAVYNRRSIGYGP